MPIARSLPLAYRCALSRAARRLLPTVCLLILLAGCGTQAPAPIITPLPNETAPTLPAPATADVSPAPAYTDTPRPESTPAPAATPTPTATPVLAPLDLVRRFSTDGAMVHIRELSSAHYAGRRAGTPGGAAAADYIATEFARLGLIPAGDSGTYLQSFSFPFVDLAAAPELAILPGSGVTPTAYSHMQDFREVITGHAGAGRADAEVVYLAGGYDSDYASLEVEGRIVLLDAARRTGTTLPAIEMAITRGAAGVLVLAVDDESVRMRPSYRQPVTDTVRPVFFVNHRVAAALAAASGATLDEKPRALAVRVHMSVTLQPARMAQTDNVLGLWPGADPALKDKYLLIGGHYDQVGQSPSGLLFPGAGDNASGIGAMLALAQSWHATGYRPRMSVLFVAWSAGEAGELGSQYYAAHPARPLHDTVAFLNLDAPGAVGSGGLAAGYGDQGLATQLVSFAHALGEPLAIERAGAGDYASFGAVGVPAVLLSAAGTNGSLHHPDDTPERVDRENLALAGQVAWLTVLHFSGTWPP